MSKSIESERFPIILNKHTVMVIHLFERHDCIEDFWMSECEHEDSIKDQCRAAHQLIDQLGDDWTPAFLLELRKAVVEKLKEHDRKYGSSWSLMK